MSCFERKPLSEETLAVLCDRTLGVAKAGHAHEGRADRARARRVEAERLWHLKDNRAFGEIRDTLRAMAPGRGFCMYCEYNIGNAIDHFWPKSRYPWRAFLWENYLWSCAICNGDHKRTRFPLDAEGRPLLIDLTQDDPRDHLSFLPLSGKYDARTDKGRKTIEVLGFERRGDLDDTRRAIWLSVQIQIITYADACARDDWKGALDAQKTLCCLPHSRLLSRLIDLAATPAGVVLIESPRCIAALDAHPEIQGWV